jgi:hypothetical protein
MPVLAPRPIPTDTQAKPAVLTFVLLQAAVLLYVFGGALWGAKVIAPLDVAASLMPHYRHVAPDIETPNNHYIIDQMSYDLPLQRTIHQAYRRGEIPWWDPYMFCGRPFIGDAHINGTDPWRLLCYFTLPFVPAYNWTLALHFAWAGAGMWLLLRRLGVSEALAIGMALAWEFAGCHVIKIGHPWILGSFSWYPWLWLALHHAWDTGCRRARIGAAISVAAIFYSGNAQSFAYVPFFFAAWTAGYGGFTVKGWVNALKAAAPAGVLGALLAAPVILNEVEFYRLNVRVIESNPDLVANPWITPWLTVLGMVHPWLLGTFQTFDASKLGGHGLWALGFRLFLGPAALGGAILAFWPSERPGGDRRPAASALLMLLAYYFILGTPLVTILYPRAAGLGALGIAVLAATGLEQIRRSERRLTGAGRAVFLWLGALTVGAHVLAFVVWPIVRPKIEARISAEEGKVGLGPAKKLRDRQFARFPYEVGFANPEGLLTAAGWAALGFGLMAPGLRSRRAFWPGLLALNLAPALLFAHRYIPHYDVALWDRLVAGTEEQRSVANAVNASGSRLWEPEGWMRFRLLPGALCHLFEVRTVTGYSAMRPPNIAELPTADRDAYLAEFGDAVYAETNGVGSLKPAKPDARFRWISGGGEVPKFTQEGLNGFRLEFQTPQAGVLWWTDSWYPGWRVLADGKPAALQRKPPCFSEITIAEPARTLEFRYRPAKLPTGLALAGCGAAGLLLSLRTRPFPKARTA